MNPTTTEAQQETLALVPGICLPEAVVTNAAKAPSFAALMGSFRAEHDSEVEAAAALMIGASTLSDYCDGKTLPRGVVLARLAPLVGLPVDELTALVEAQRAAQARGETIATVAPIRTRKMRSVVHLDVATDPDRNLALGPNQNGEG